MGKLSSKKTRVKETDTYEPEEEELTVLHRAKFVDWSPTAVVAIALTDDNSCAAIARESGAIELWDTDTWHCLLAIPGKEDASLSSLAWVGPVGTNSSSTPPTDALASTPAPRSSWRLFSGGLDGQLVEWDVAQRRPLAATSSSGGAVWAMAVEPPSARQPGSPAHLALACDDGVTRLFTVEEGGAGAQYCRSLPALKGRLLSIAWHPSGGFLFVGTSVGTIHAWDLASSQEVLRINAGDGSGEEQCVWALRVLRDGTLVSGSSGGSVQFWDGAMGTLLFGFKKHEADILALALAEPNEAPLAPGTPGGPSPPDSQQPHVFASGVDSRVACFTRLRHSDGREEWVYLDSKRGHSHDVRCMEVLRSRSGDRLLLSGGNDAQLLVHSVRAFSQDAAVRVCKCPEPVLATLVAAPASGLAMTEANGGSATGGGLLLTAQHSTLDLWLLGQTATKQQQARSVSGYDWSEGALVDLRVPPRHLARIATSGGAHVMAAALSAAGNLIAYSDALQGTQLLEVRQATGGELALPVQATGLSLGRRKLILRLPPACQLAFVGADRLALLRPDGELLIAKTASGEVLASFPELKRDAGGPSPAQGRGNQGTACEQVGEAATLLSLGGCWAATASSRHLHLYNLETLTHHGQLPSASEEAGIVAVGMAPDGSLLAAATADNDLLLYDVATCRVASWSDDNPQLPRRFRDMPGTVSRISFNPSPLTRAALLHTASSLCHVDFSKPAAAEGEGHPVGRRKRRRNGGSCPAGSNFRVLELDNACLFAAFSSPHTALLAEKAWAEVAATFPPPLYRHRYGT